MINDYEKLSREELIRELEKRDKEIAELKKTSKGPEVEVMETNEVNEGDVDHLDLHSIKRYSRQLILPEIGPTGQCKLKSAAVLIVGCGGLGCPAAIYLAAAGIGCLGLVDYDDVEESNLHRQILHTEGRIGHSKVSSVAKSVRELNSNVKCVLHKTTLTSSNIMDIISKYDVVLDCTDNVATRYLLNDACVLSSKPLVSGSALRFDGQLTVYGFLDGPCYRCLFPEPPPPETVTNCSDGGVLGVVPGVIGCMQALEAIKLISGCGEVCSKKLILFDGLTCTFRLVRVRHRLPNCKLCGSNPSLTTLIDYEQFCGSAASDKEKELDLLTPEDRISVSDLQRIIEDKEPHLLVDVRNPIELEICILPGVINIPLSNISNEKDLETLKSKIEDVKTSKVICVCRRGNDSQKAVLSLKKEFPQVSVVDVAGGLTAWAKQIDKSFPVY